MLSLLSNFMPKCRLCFGNVTPKYRLCFGNVGLQFSQYCQWPPFSVSGCDGAGWGAFLVAGYQPTQVH